MRYRSYNISTKCWLLCSWNIKIPADILLFFTGYKVRHDSWGDEGLQVAQGSDQRRQGVWKEVTIILFHLFILYL